MQPAILDLERISREGVISGVSFVDLVQGAPTQTHPLIVRDEAGVYHDRRSKAEPRPIILVNYINRASLVLAVAKHMSKLEPLHLFSRKDPRTAPIDVIWWLHCTYASALNRTWTDVLHIDALVDISDEECCAAVKAWLPPGFHDLCNLIVEYATDHRVARRNRACTVASEGLRAEASHYKNKMAGGAELLSEHYRSLTPSCDVMPVPRKSDKKPCAAEFVRSPYFDALGNASEPMANLIDLIREKLGVTFDENVTECPGHVAWAPPINDASSAVPFEFVVLCSGLGATFRVRNAYKATVDSLIVEAEKIAVESKAHLVVYHDKQSKAAASISKSKKPKSRRNAFCWFPTAFCEKATQLLEKIEQARKMHINLCHNGRAVHVSADICTASSSWVHNKDMPSFDVDGSLSVVDPSLPWGCRPDGANRRIGEVVKRVNDLSEWRPTFELSTPLSLSR